jgi:hypothetical protein
VGAVAAALGDAAQLLDVEVDELAGRRALVAADDPPAWPVQHGQPVQAVAAPEAVHGPGRPANPGGDPGRAELVLAAELV